MSFQPPTLLKSHQKKKKKNNSCRAEKTIKEAKFQLGRGPHGVTCKAGKKEIMIPPGLSKNGQQYLSSNIPPRSAPVGL